MGVDLSRSKVYYYKHNDLADLELVLKKIAKDVARLGRDVTKQVLKIEEVSMALSFVQCIHF